MTKQEAAEMVYLAADALNAAMRNAAVEGVLVGLTVEKREYLKGGAGISSLLVRCSVPLERKGTL